jgi:hypothetical protein
VNSSNADFGDVLDTAGGYDDSYPTDITTSLYATDSGMDNEPFTILDQSKVSSYRLAVDHLVRTLRSDDANALPPVVWSIVNAARSIAEDAEAYDEKYGRMVSMAESERLTALRGKVSVQLTELIAAVKNHARIIVDGGDSPSKVNVERAKVESSVASLTATVLELVKMLQSAPASAPSAAAHSNAGSVRSRMGSAANALDRMGSGGSFRVKAGGVGSPSPLQQSSSFGGSAGPGPDGESLRVSFDFAFFLYSCVESFADLFPPLSFLLFSLLFSLLSCSLKARRTRLSLRSSCCWRASRTRMPPRTRSASI